MRRLVPIRDSVVCKKISGGTTYENRGGIKVKVTTIDLYEIISVPEIVPEGFTFKPGDRIISNSTGDEIELNPGEIVYLFKIENLMCLVDEKETV